MYFEVTEGFETLVIQQDDVNTYGGSDLYMFTVSKVEDDTDSIVDTGGGFLKISDEFDMIRAMQEYAEDEYKYLFDRLIELLEDGTYSASGEMLL